jgi:transglutaminase-like putative cysteine protease
MNIKRKPKQKLAALPELPIPNGAMTWLMMSLAASIGWHIPHIPIWATVTAVLVGAYTYYRIIKSKPMPPQFLRILLAICVVGGILVTFRSYLGRDPGVTALVLFGTMKLMEIKNRRDFMVIVFICYFMVFANFLYDQSIEDLAFTLVAALLITATLLRLNHPPEEKIKISTMFRFSLRLIVYSIPFTVMLFFLFPRTTGPLWNLSQESVTRFQSGFNDVIEPGQIAQLAQSKLPAFKVEFPNNDRPGMKDLYFRGLVLWFTNGKLWRQGVLTSRYVRPRSYDREGILHVVTIEPHNRTWLFGLDWPVVVPGWSRTLPGGIFQTRRSIRSHYRYRVLSRFDPAELGDLPGNQRRWAMQFPTGSNRRIRELGRSWGDQAGSDEEILQLAERFFKESDFVYTLNPGLMESNEPLEEFLFNERRGFCEHYASAFTMLMRAAGVPARVVIGFQGGEFNPVGNYLLVRQSDAHAWSEVWLEGKGWRRIDPTAWVAPERIEFGMDVSRNISSLGNLSDEDRIAAIQRAQNPGIFEKIYKFFKHHWDNINYKWDVWIISYDRDKQRDFFRDLGFENIGRFGLLIAALFVVAVFFFSISFLLRRQILSTDPLVRLYQKFCLKLGKSGLQRMRWEGPIHYRDRAIDKFPDKADLILAITDLFIHLRYGRLDVTKARLNQLKRQIRLL